jgi:hypothetical protein
VPAHWREHEQNRISDCQLLLTAISLKTSALGILSSIFHQLTTNAMKSFATTYPRSRGIKLACNLRRRDLPIVSGGSAMHDFLSGNLLLWL